MQYQQGQSSRNQEPYRSTNAPHTHTHQSSSYGRQQQAHEKQAVRQYDRERASQYGQSYPTGSSRTPNAASHTGSSVQAQRNLLAAQTRQRMEGLASLPQGPAQTPSHTLQQQASSGDSSIANSTGSSASSAGSAGSGNRGVGGRPTSPNSLLTMNQQMNSLSSTSGRNNPNYDPQADAHMQQNRHAFNAATNSFRATAAVDVNSPSAQRAALHQQQQLLREQQLQAAFQVQQQAELDSFPSVRVGGPVSHSSYTNSAPSPAPSGPNPSWPSSASAARPGSAHSSGQGSANGSAASGSSNESNSKQSSQQPHQRSNSGQPGDDRPLLAASSIPTTPAGLPGEHSQASYDDAAEQQQYLEGEKQLHALQQQQQRDERAREYASSSSPEDRTGFTPADSNGGGGGGGNDYDPCPQRFGGSGGGGGPGGQSGTSIPGFEDLVKIFESRQTIVLRGVRQSDGMECVLKMPNLRYLNGASKPEEKPNGDGSSAASGTSKKDGVPETGAPSRHRLAVFAQQYELLKNLEARKIEGVIKAYDLLSIGPNGNSLCLMCEYFPGPSLQSYMASRLFSRGFGVLELLKLGISISHTLGQIHAENVLHRDLTASNILYDRASQTMKIIDFGLAGTFPIHGVNTKKNTALQGTLNYLSPEQTGRVSRAVDYRTDLYSLGVVLYQMATGQLPLTSDDPLELIHCIIAKMPVSPHILKPSIPKVLADIIMKLLAKNAEARYQSAWGVKADLARVFRMCVKEREKREAERTRRKALEAGANASARTPSKPTSPALPTSGAAAATPGAFDTRSVHSAVASVHSATSSDSQRSGVEAGSISSEKAAQVAKEDPAQLLDLGLNVLEQDLIECAPSVAPPAATPAQPSSSPSLESGADAAAAELPYQNLPSFTLARYDVFSKLNIPDKLYGREKEIASLLQTFDEMNTNSNLHVAVVSGAGGSGKSSIVRSVLQTLEKRALFASSKLDQFKRIPYDCFIAVIHELVMEILAKSTSRVRKWEKKIMAALGVNAALMTELFPSLKQIIGEQPSVASLSTNEAVHRLNIVFCRLICAFASKRRPLVLFFDDMQWADPASLKMIQLFCTDRSSHHVLLILSYRTEDTEVTVPLLDMIASIHAAGTPLKQLPLLPLTVRHINTLLCDTFNSSADPGRTMSLAGFIAAKSGGNPFFIHQILRTLHANHFLKFSVDSSKDVGVGEWSWDENALQNAELGDSVVDLITAKITSLPSQSQRVLKLAACIGAKFDLETLAIIAELPRSSTQAALHEALREELVMQIRAAVVPSGVSLWRREHDQRLKEKEAEDAKQAAAASTAPTPALAGAAASAAPAIPSPAPAARVPSLTRDDSLVPLLQAPPVRRNARSSTAGSTSSNPPSGTDTPSPREESTAMTITRRAREMSDEAAQFKQEQTERKEAAEAERRRGPSEHSSSAGSSKASGSGSPRNDAAAPALPPGGNTLPTSGGSSATPASASASASHSTSNPNVTTGSGDSWYTEITYAWLHDRVQQAAYNLIEQDLREHTHVHIGTLLLQSIRASAHRALVDSQDPAASPSPAAVAAAASAATSATTTSPAELAISTVDLFSLPSNEARLFDLVSHFNVGLKIVLGMDNSMRAQVAELNLAAARKAKLAASYTAALEYCRAGMLLLGFEKMGGSTTGSKVGSAVVDTPSVASQDLSHPSNPHRTPGSQKSGSSSKASSVGSSNASSASQAATAVIAEVSSLESVPLIDRVDPWRSFYKLCYELYSERADIEFLCGNTFLAEGYIKVAMEHAVETHDQVTLLLRMAHQRTSAGEYTGAISCGIQSLQLLHVNFFNPGAAAPTSSPPPRLPLAPVTLAAGLSVPSFGSQQGIVSELAHLGFSVPASSWYRSSHAHSSAPADTKALGVTESTATPLAAQPTHTHSESSLATGASSAAEAVAPLPPADTLLTQVSNVTTGPIATPLYNSASPPTAEAAAAATDAASRSAPSSAPPSPALSTTSSASTASSGSGSMNTSLLLGQLTEHTLRQHYLHFKFKLREFNHKHSQVHHAMAEQLQAAQGASASASVSVGLTRASNSVTGLIDLPTLTDKHQHLIALTYASLITPCWISHQPLLRLICFKAALHALEHGLCGSESFPLLMLASILMMDFNEIERGQELAAVCFKISERFAAAPPSLLGTNRSASSAPTLSGPGGSLHSGSDRAKLCIVNAGLISHWVSPLDHSLPLIDQAFHLGLQIGDLAFSGYSFVFKITTMFYCGKNLELLYEDVLKSKLSNQKILNNSLTSEFLTGLEFLLLNLNGYDHYTSEFELITPSANEINFMTRCESSSAALALTTYLIFRAHMLYHYGHPWLALQCLHHAKSKIVYLTSWISQAYFVWLTSLCQLALLAKHPPTAAVSPTMGKSASAASGSLHPRSPTMESVLEVPELSTSPEAVSASGPSAPPAAMPHPTSSAEPVTASSSSALPPPSTLDKDFNSGINPSTNFGRAGQWWG